MNKNENITNLINNLQMVMSDLQKKVDNIEKTINNIDNSLYELKQQITENTVDDISHVDHIIEDCEIFLQEYDDCLYQYDLSIEEDIHPKIKELQNFGYIWYGMYPIAKGDYQQYLKLIHHYDFEVFELLEEDSESLIKEELTKEDFDKLQNNTILAADISSILYEIYLNMWIDDRKDNPKLYEGMSPVSYNEFVNNELYNEEISSKLYEKLILN